jgi:hypothetical protein
VGVAQDVPPGPEYQGAVAVQQGGEGAFVPPADELPEQLAVTGLLAFRFTGKVAEVPQDVRQGLGHHVLVSGV